MQKNEYMLFNGSAMEISLNRFKAMIEKNMFKIPSFEKILRFDNDARFLADVTCVYKTEEFGIITVNYGNIFNVLNNRDMYHEFYSLFLHKNYPLIVNGSIVLNTTGRLDIMLTGADSIKDGYCPNGYTGFDLNMPGENADTRGVQVIRSEEIHDYIKILSRKDHTLGNITAPHLSKFSGDELATLRKADLIDITEFMYEAWDSNDAEKTKAYLFQTEHEKSGKDIYKDSTYANEAITGMLSIYELEIDCASFNIDGSNVVLFENIFQDNICLKRDFPEYMVDQADYWVESTVMSDLMKEEFNIMTSLLLTEIDPDADGKVRLTVVNKLINDVRTDHGWYM